MTHTRIKICGITRVEDAETAIANGADAIGLVFYARSPRNVSVEQALEIVGSVPPFVTVVALFVNELPDRIHRIVNTVGIDQIQFHGDEAPDFCAQFGRPWLKALRVRPELDIRLACQDYAAARGILLDSWQDGVPGGTGKTFDWELAPRDLDLPVVLAGGLDAGNVGAAIDLLRPCAVDISGGVERKPGIKDPEKIRLFTAAVRAADTLLDECNDK